MTGLRQSVADAIQRDQESGGGGILTDEEVAAVEWAITRTVLMHPEGDRECQQHREALSILLHELGPRRMSIHGAEDRRCRYWLQCADVAIKAYDDWLEQRNSTPAQEPAP